MDSIVRFHIVFSGRVQGVGFRWRAKNAANRFGTTGWVRNLWNGNVEMEIQGTQRQVNQVLIALKDSIYIDIEDIRLKKIQPLDAERRFVIADDHDAEAI